MSQKGSTFAAGYVSHGVWNQITTYLSSGVGLARLLFYFMENICICHFFVVPLQLKYSLNEHFKHNDYVY